MSNFDLVVRNGTVVTAGDVTRCDVGVTAGRVAALGEHLASGSTEIDAKGRLVMPGGIDAHCHLDQPQNVGAAAAGALMADDFRSGSISAAFGGTTTIVPFAVQLKAQSLRDAVADYHRRAEGKAVIDYAFHIIISDPTESVLKDELPSLARDGYTSVKVYMTYPAMRLDDGQILDVLEAARQQRIMVMIHAENLECITWLTQRLEAAGNTAPRFHAASRPMAVEREATHRAITLAELADVSILIVHVSGREAIDQIRWGQQRGLHIYGETCPQYLMLSEEDLDLPDFEGAKCMCSPPPRDRANQNAVWNALRTGVLSVFSSDHAPYRFDDPNGKKLHGSGATFSKVANGIPGLETRLPLLFHEGVVKGRLTLEQFVAVTATSPAKTYGLYPRKGTIAVGSDADLAVWDLGAHVTIANDRLHHNVDYTPFEGMKVSAWPTTVISRGEIVCNQGELLARPGRGQFLRRASPASPVGTHLSALSEQDR